MQKEWFKDWFSSKDYLDVYNHRNEKDAEEIIKLIFSNITLPQNANILDAACGTGRHTIKFAELGFNVTAFDLSKTLLEIAKKNAEEKNLKIKFLLSDIRNIFICQKFDLIVSLFTSFGYFKTDEENFKFVENGFKMLNPEGYFVLDFFNKNHVEKNLIPFSEKEIDGKKIFEHRRIIDNRVVKEIKIERMNREYNYVESVRLYSYNELVKNFTKIGFKVIKTLGNYLGSDFNLSNSERCIIIFQK
jgi:2-polyprenyl-3-methyl-5-hydroxy-6-metoxy-1,4-benzoquinol methylase